MVWKKKDDRHYTWESLNGMIAPEVLHAPKTGGAPNGEWPIVHERVVQYLLRHVVGTPWANQLALIAAVLFARRLDVQSVYLTLQYLHPRFSAIFAGLGLKAMDEWKNELHLPLYFKGEIAPGDSQNTRQQFLLKYTSSTRHVQNWLDSLPEAERQQYQQFTLPEVGSFLYEQLDKWKEISVICQKF